ncbi:MAG TPA: DUF169 domain-containing protein [Syntrophomonadaceae bacterium]|nr:DUF169 domain-containing protein [Syntrophomonadaceae bacterium]
MGFGDQYKNFPIDHFLSTGTAQLGESGERAVRLEGEHYCKTPAIARKFVEQLPIREVAGEYVVFKPLEKVVDGEEPAVVAFLVNPDQLSALVVMANYARESNENVIAPFGAGCHSILFAYAEAEKDEPRAVIGFIDITVRKHVEKDILSFTIPYKMFLEMEAEVEGSFLQTEQWLKIAERI